MFKILKLRTSILLGFAVPIAIFIIAAFIVIVSVQDTEKATNLATRTHLVNQNALKLELALSTTLRGVRGYILTQSQANKDTVEQGDKNFLQTSEELKSSIIDSEQQARILQLQNLQKDIMLVANQEIALVDQGNLKAATDMAKTTQVSSSWTNFKTTITAFYDKQQSLLKERSEQQTNALQKLGTIAWSSCVIAALSAIFLGIWSASRISRVLNDLLNTLASSSAEMSATVEQHERTVMQQSSSVSETSATTEELRVSAQTSSDQAENAAAVVKKALQLTQEGSFSSARASEGMGELQEKVRAVAEQILQLSEQAGQIGAIAKVVGDLASETNMLALNAAVEAARAGENGKGFAVVASEVRKLADQSKKSAERANILVADIQKATNSAVMVAEEGRKTAKEVFDIAMKSGEIFQSLSEYSSMIDQNAQQVVLNSRQQAGALSQIGDAMKNLNAGATEMAAGSKQTKIGIQSLVDVATSLRTML